MSATNIEWTSRTWNPVTGCTKVSQGCKHCYAEGVAARFWKTQYPQVEYVTCSGSRGCDHAGGSCVPFTETRPREFTDVQTHADRLLEPLSWRKPDRVFVNSMSDLFHEAVPDEFVDRVFAVMALADRHTFQILTKRPQRMRAYMEWRERRDQVRNARLDVQQFVETYWSKSQLLAGYARSASEWERLEAAPWPLENVWLGASVEDQANYDARIGHLLRTPAAVRFLSCEPLLGPIDMRMGGASLPDYSAHDPLPRLDWAIVGGESGHGARPFNIAWARSIVGQCRAARVSVFVKQLGATAFDGFYSDEDTESMPCEVHLKDRKGGDPAEWPDDLRIREFPR